MLALRLSLRRFPQQSNSRLSAAERATLLVSRDRVDDDTPRQWLTAGYCHAPMSPLAHTQAGFTALWLAVQIATVHPQSLGVLAVDEWGTPWPIDPAFDEAVAQHHEIPRHAIDQWAVTSRERAAADRRDPHCELLWPTYAVEDEKFTATALSEMARQPPLFDADHGRLTRLNRAVAGECAVLVGIAPIGREPELIGIAPVRREPELIGIAPVRREPELVGIAPIGREPKNDAVSLLKTPVEPDFPRVSSPNPPTERFSDTILLLACERRYTTAACPKLQPWIEAAQAALEQARRVREDLTWETLKAVVVREWAGHWPLVFQKHWIATFGTAVALPLNPWGGDLAYPTGTATGDLGLLSRTVAALAQGETALIVSGDAQQAIALVVAK